MKNTTDVKISGVKAAVGEFNNWQGAAIIYFDKVELKVWTMIYIDSNDYDDYHDVNVVRAIRKNNAMGKWDKTSMAALKEKCINILNGVEDY